MWRWFAVGVVLAVGACAAGESATGSRYAVFYQEWSAALGPDAKGVVDAAGGYALRHPGLPVTVVGFADPDGSPQANIDISRTRARVVSDELVAMGVPAARIQNQARGAVNFQGASQESRRVEIDVGSPSP